MSTITTKSANAPSAVEKGGPTVLARIGKAVIYLLLAIGTVICLMPFVWLLRSSLMDTGQIFSYPPEWIPDPFAWSNYSGALEQAPFGIYFVNTVWLIILIVPGTLLSTSAAAFAFSHLRWRGRTACFAMLMSAMMLPYAATLVPTFIGWQYLGFVDTYVPLALPAWFGAGGAYYIFLLRQFFGQLPRALDEAVFMDGGSPWTVYWRLILPLSKGPLTLVAIFTILGTWNDLLNPLVYLSDSRSFTLSLGLASFRSMYSSQWGYLMAASLIVILPMMVLFAFAQKQIMGSLSLSGLKG